MIQDQASMRNVDSKIRSPRFDCCVFLFYSLSAATFSTASTRLGHRPALSSSSGREADFSPTQEPITLRNYQRAHYVENEVYFGATMTASSEDDCPVSADEALARLMTGNARFLRGEPRFLRTPTEVLADLVKGQRPFATILCCSDSRVPPELIFDAKIGDLFVVRVAGNVMSPEIGGSLQYAGTHLKTQLFMVLGHEGCGAVQAALAAKFQGVQERSRIQSLLENILPGLDEVEPQLPPQQKLERAVESNVRWSMRQILETPEGRARMAEGRMKLVGAVCEIATGRVRLLA